MDLLIIPRDTDSFSDIDSGIIIYNEKSKLSVTNLNDWFFKNIYEKISKSNKAKIDKYYYTIQLYVFRFMPHTHNYCSKSNKKLSQSLNNQRKEFINRYEDTHKIINSKIHLPFAAGSKYIGPLSKYEKFRPKISVKKILNRDPKAVYIKPFGKRLIYLRLI